MLPKIDFGIFEIDSLIFFWIIGIILSQAFYVGIAVKFGWKWYKGLCTGLLILLYEIIGAKIFYYMENPRAASEPFSLGGGYSLFGVFFFLPLFLFLQSLVQKESFLKLMDFAAVGILIELSFYRVGCMCVGCCGGIRWDRGIVIKNKTYFPVQPIEASLDMLSAIGLIILLVKTNTKKGEIFYLTYALYGIIRFILEFFRERNVLFLEMSISHIFAFIVFVFGIIMYVLSRCGILEKKKK